ncbi:S-layer homology domain-containing protein [Ruminiclostridium herbifermentans]|uniref:S-layer homology domain-containing protein n=1 Tax=Ruminiclostridium herbifermentans TaxID=2488810 RepID=A0A7H1VRY1_9FIRM|nr:S-layer homology domain-containing protein [Ruminiclostridium herbifermentans]QNU68143.1 S-layer homology domain-containing protein [Ruminiclostridium herbifermentans]
MKRKVIKIFSLVTVFPIVLICIFGVYAASVMTVYGNYYNNNWQQSSPIYSNVALSASSPKEGQTSVSTDTSITLKFSGDILFKSSQQETQIYIIDNLNRKIDIDIKTSDSNKLVIKPKTTLKENTFYKLYVNNLKDSKGITIKAFSVSFTTGKDNNSRFTDVDKNHWAYNAIIELSKRGIISGFSDNSYKPNESITRSQFASMLTKTLNLTTTSTNQTFEDVPVTNWDYKAVEAAKIYLTGYKSADGKMYFYGNKSSVREDMAVALVKALGLSVVSNDSKLKSTFSDYDSISKNLRSYVYTAYINNIMVGSNGKFNAQGSLTRAEAASLLFKIIERTEKVVVDNSEKVDKVVVSDAYSKSNDATLSGLKYDGNNVQGFQKNVSVYNVVLPVGTKNIPKVTAKANDTKAKVTITQADKLPGNATVVVTAEDGKTTMTYKIYFQVKANDDATLSSLKYDGNNVQGFQKNVSVYNVMLPVGTKNIPKVTAKANDTKAKVTITQADKLPGNATVVVTAEDGKTTMTYKIYFQVKANDDATLSSLKYDGNNVQGFQKNVSVYNVMLPEGTKNIPKVTAKANDTKAKVTITQADKLPGNATVVVTAEDGKTTMTYKIYFQVKANDDATLSSLKYDGNNVQGFQKNVSVYNVVLPEGTKNIPKVTAKANASKAKVTITQADKLPGNATVVVTAEDGKTTMTYKIYFLVRTK